MLAKSMGKPSSYPGFKALLEEWNQKLKESGFEDAEERSTGTLRLRKPASLDRFQKTDEITREARAHYYDVIGEKIIETSFDSDLEEKIVTYYFEGFTQA